MAESQATRKPTTPKKSISSATKRPQKTQKFIDDLKQALDDFDDEVFSFTSEQREAAYHNFVTYYRDALTAIWPKATDASIKTILKSVTDKQLQELKRMASLLKPDQPKPTVVTEKRTVPALEHILGVLTSRLPQQNLPSTEVCGLISNIFSDLSTAHGVQAKAAQGIAELASLIAPEQMTLILAAAVPPQSKLYCHLVPHRRFRHHHRPPLQLPQKLKDIMLLNIVKRTHCLTQLRTASTNVTRRHQLEF